MDLLKKVAYKDNVAAFTFSFTSDENTSPFRDVTTTFYPICGTAP